jgi:transaldolase
MPVAEPATARTMATSPSPMTQAEFLWQHHQDPMAVEKLAEGIRLFAVDQVKLEQQIQQML